VARATLALLLVVSVSACESAPPAPRIALAPPSAQLPGEGFTYIASLRELPDGRVLLVDQWEKRFVVADLGAGTVTPVARAGAGPSEYRAVGSLWALGGDTTVMIDHGAAQWLILAGTRVVEKWTRSSSVVAGMIRPRRVDGADLAGRVVWTAAAPRPLLGGDTFDSTWVIRTDRTTGDSDTLTRGIRVMRPGFYSTTPARQVMPAGGGGGASSANGRYSVWHDLREFDAVAMFPDGWVAVARFNPYRVDWCPPAQTSCTPGPVIEERRPYTDEEKRAFLEMYGSKRALPTTDLSRVSGWPPTVPPFVQRNTKANPMHPLRSMPDGRLLIERVESLGSPANSYDIVDRRGVLVGTMKLAANDRVVGFGTGSIYTTVTDSDDIERLRRHPWP
jgi:hypothetical protein